MGLSQHKMALIGVDGQHPNNELKDTQPKNILTISSLMFDHDRLTALIKCNYESQTGILPSNYSSRSRGMELSEIIKFNERLYSVDEQTGIVFDVTDGETVPRTILSAGDGTKSTGCQAKWMARKDGKLYIGSPGHEIMNKDRSILHDDHQWVKLLQSNGAVKHVNWEPYYSAIRSAVGYSFPGYLAHEGVTWSDIHKQWFFLPRNVSKSPYNHVEDQSSCGNMLIRCSEDFSEIFSIQISDFGKTKGCSSLKFIPGTDDQVLVCLLSETSKNKQSSFITVFTIDGKMILEDFFIANVKYRGLEFID